jgi:hypothetical protein
MHHVTTPEAIAADKLTAFAPVVASPRRRRPVSAALSGMNQFGAVKGTVLTAAALAIVESVALVAALPSWSM